MQVHLYYIHKQEHVPQAGAAVRLFITISFTWIPHIFYTDFFIYNHAYVHQYKLFFLIYCGTTICSIYANRQKRGHQ